MKLIFISNFLNHHQLPFCEEVIRIIGMENFRFIATTAQPDEQRALGYVDMNKQAFCIRYYESPEGKKLAKQWLNDANVILIGGVSYRYSFKQWLRGKIVIKYGERIYKKETEGYSIKGILNMLLFHQLSLKKTDYFLAASAYAAADYWKHGAYKGRMLRWGYFPPSRSYDISTLFTQKNSNEILWCGRLIDWKHPEIMIELAKRFENDGIDYQFTVIGNGPLHGLLNKAIEEDHLHIHLIGAVPSDQVRDYMEKAGIMLSTSDYNEGWGAVINEGMNSACAVVASIAMGSVPFLIQNGINGIVFDYHDIDKCYHILKELLRNPQMQRELGSKAYSTIVDKWNGRTAATNLIAFLEGLKHGKIVIPDEGPCSKAEILMNPTER